MFDVVVGWIESTGYLGILVLMLGENAFPPLPSEVIMPLAGYQAARGDLHIVGVIAVGTAGSVLGALFWYVGARIGMGRLRRWTGRHGRWLTLCPPARA
jgi:membrane protein DedA with SNARE-associated domain